MRTRSRILKFLWPAGLTLAIVLALLSGCGGGGSGGETTSDTGEVVIGLTDAEGDFTRYDVNVLSIQLTKADGTLVETLPLATRVDFAELTELTEFVTAATIPSGVYTHASMTLDYTEAVIEVEHASGNPVAATALDASGDPIDTLEVAVQFDNRRALRIAPGVPAHLTLDFDLDATNEVDMDGPEPVVLVRPLLIADVNPERPKIHRVRGSLLSVDEFHESFVLSIRPFRTRQSNFGRLRVETASETAYEVDGVTGVGSEGFALLAEKPVGTAVLAVGDLQVPSRRFVAREVYAGSSVPGGDLDALTGTVLAREDNLLTVRGRALDRGGSITFHIDVQVEVGDATTVSCQADPGAALTIDDISVGQHLVALGDFDLDTATLDATAGHVRLLVTRVSGTVVRVRPSQGDAGGEIDLDLQAIQGRRIGLFDFIGTGAIPEDDSDPHEYTVSTGVMSLPFLETEDPVRVFGFVAPFGSAPPDFEARTVEDASEAAAHLRIRWRTPGPDALTVDTVAQTLALDLEGVGLLHHVFRSGIAVELDEEPAPRLVPEGDSGLYAVRRAGPTTVYGSFEDFAAVLAREVETAEVVYVSAHGDFADDTQLLTARRVVVGLR